MIWFSILSSNLIIFFHVQQTQATNALLGHVCSWLKQRGSNLSPVFFVQVVMTVVYDDTCSICLSDASMDPLYYRSERYKALNINRPAHGAISAYYVTLSRVSHVRKRVSLDPRLHAKTIYLVCTLYIFNCVTCHPPRSMSLHPVCTC